MNAARRRLPAVAGILALLAFAAFGLVRAVDAGSAPTRQQQVDAIAATIRCPTCQGLSIKDSPSILADGSRQIVEEQVAQGRAPDEVRQYFVDRYGEFVLLSPDPGGSALLVWLLPGLALVAGGGLVWRWLQTNAVNSPRAAAPVEGEADGDASVALRAFRSGSLTPDDSAAGEALREALMVRLAWDQDDVLDDEAIRRADLRLGATYRRYRTREQRAHRTVRPRRTLPRRAVTGMAVSLLMVATGSALAFGVSARGAYDLPTGDLPGGNAAAAPAEVAAPGLADLLASTRSRPADAQGWVALGRAYEAGGQLSDAVAAYERALALRPSDDVALLRAGVLVNAGSAAEAMPVVVDLANRYPDDPDTVLLLGLAQDRTGAPETTATLRRFLELAPDAPTAPAVRRLLAGR